MLHGPIFEKLFGMKHWVRLLLLPLALTTGAGVQAQIFGEPAPTKEESEKQELAWDIYASGFGNRRRLPIWYATGTDSADGACMLGNEGAALA